MKKILSLLAVVMLVIATSCTKPGYTVTGTVADNSLDSTYVYLYDMNQEDRVPLDSTLIANKSFKFTGTADTAKLVMMVVKYKEVSGSSPFVLTNAKLTANVTFITIDSTKVPAISIKGTPENDDFAKLNAADDENNLKMRALYNNPDTTKMDSINNEVNRLDSLMAITKEQYINNHINMPSSAFVFQYLQYGMSSEEQEAYLAKCNEAFKSIPMVDKIVKHLAILKKVAVGQKFTDFTMNNEKGEQHKLSEYVGNGKVTLIDFWASWCGPCRGEMPNVVKAYAQFKNKNFEIVGVSLDSNAENWTKAIKDLKITWPQLSDLQGWKNAGAQLYGVNSIPHTVLVDKDGTIIANDLRGEELIKKLTEILK